MVETAFIAENLTALRLKHGLSQGALAQRCGLKRQQINYFETGARTPSIEQLLRIAQALDVSLHRLLTGEDRPGVTIRDIALELRALGLVDLWVEDPVVPGAFRHPEEVIVLAILGTEPAARVLEAVPALLAWNRWDYVLLWAFARVNGRVLNRLAWLADVTLALERGGGFPGGCPGKEDLTRFVKRVKPPKRDWIDPVGHPSPEPSRSPIWKRWGIGYAADLSTFRKRAESLLSESTGKRRAVQREGRADG